MKIVHVFRSPIGGIFRHVRDLLSQQSAAGHEVGIICDSKTGGDYEANLFEQIKPDLALGLHRIAIPRAISPFDASALLNTYLKLRKIKPDVVHSHSAKGGIHGRLAAKLVSTSAHPVKAFYCPHGGAMHYDANSLKGKLFFSAERFMERFTESLIFVSQYEADAYRDKVGEPRCPQAIIYNGISDEEFLPVQQKNGAADFLYIGMMRDLKGADVFLDAISIAKHKSSKPVTAMFVGDGPDKEKYIDQIKRLGLEETVAVHPAMPAREAFAQADMVVVPSRAESLPYLVLEAIGGHMPVIATNVGGIPEIFLESSNELVEPGNAEALAARMLEVLSYDNRSVRSQEAAKKLKKRFSLPVMAQGIEGIYNR
ncbi:MAG: glycosyltransferase [Pseudomonadota bacterium]